VTPRIRSLPICSLLASSTLVKHRTAQQSAVPGRWQHGKPGEKSFHDVICNQWFWLARSKFRPGDDLNVQECPDPSSSCEGSGSETAVFGDITDTKTVTHCFFNIAQGLSLGSWHLCRIQYRLAVEGIIAVNWLSQRVLPKEEVC